MRNYINTFISETNKTWRTCLLFIDEASSNEISLNRVKNIVPFLYYFILSQAFSMLGLWQSNPLPASQFKPTWPLLWSQSIPFDTTYSLIVLCFLTTACIGVLWWHYSWARIIAFLGVLEYYAFANSFGSIEHGWLVWVNVAFLFSFLPNLWTKSGSPNEKLKFLTLFWGTQLFILTMYFMAGIGKITNGITQLLQQQEGIFFLDSAALHVSSWLYKTNSTSILGNWIIEHSILGWIGFLIITYIQIASLSVAFKPNLHRTWGILLAFSHIAIYLAMNIFVSELIPLVLLLLGQSPFALRSSSIQEKIQSLPLFGAAISRFVAK